MTGLQTSSRCSGGAPAVGSVMGPSAQRPAMGETRRERTFRADLKTAGLDPERPSSILRQTKRWRDVYNSVR